MTVGFITLLCSLAIIASCAGAPHGRSRDEWQRARAVAEQHLRAAYGEPPAWKIDAELSGLPYLFQVESPQEGAVLVHDNAVVTQKGMAALDRYLRGSRCIEQRLPNARELVILLQLLDAWPPDPKPTAYFLFMNPNAAWRPRLDYMDGGRATLTLYYRIDTEPDEDVGDGDDTEGMLREWTLTMDPGQMPRWTSKTRTWNRERRVFVDHTN